MLVLKRNSHERISILFLVQANFIFAPKSGQIKEMDTGLEMNNELTVIQLVEK